MPYSSAGQSSDFEKLQMAFHDITSKFGSFDNFLEAFGLASMPTAQRYGILFGCLVFIFTVASVLALLVLGGSFKRMAEQATTGEATITEGYRSRLERSLLLERLLDSRHRMLTQNYPNREQRTEGKTNLTKMLLNVPLPEESKSIAALVDDNSTKGQVNKKGQRADCMEGYKENFVIAYRKCQDKPGGKKLQAL